MQNAGFVGESWQVFAGQPRTRTRIGWGGERHDICSLAQDGYAASRLVLPLTCSMRDCNRG
jgi:hypothetical protein